MLSYQHDYHAGNHADVLKHSVLALLIEALERKTAPLRVIDTHAGSGVYDLTSKMAQHGREFENGAALVMSASDSPPCLRPYLSVLEQLNGDGVLRYYPGSPELARSLLREQDELELFELHPQAAAALRARYRGDRRVHIHDRDGFEGVVAVVPPPERRGIALIDPSYERKDEFTRVGEVIGACHKRFASGVYVVWYPLIRHLGPEILIDALRELRLPRLFHVELEVAPTSDALRGSGLLIVNLPYAIEGELGALLPWLERKLRRGDRGSATAEWLE
jgi:23S rRNA (adenine2030-N6)-methyltransferase